MNRLLSAFLASTLVVLPTPAYGLRGQEAAQTGLEEQLRKALRSPDDLVNRVSAALGLNPAAGLEEPGLPGPPPDFGRGDYKAIGIGGHKAHRLRPQDKILPGVTYETPSPGRHEIPFDQVRVGTQIAVRQIQSYAVPLGELGRFALAPLTFQIVPMGADQIIQPPEEDSGGGVAVAPMAKRYLLQVWLNNGWADLDMVHLEDGVPVIIGREDLPREIFDPNTQQDLEGEIGWRVDDERYRRVFKGWHTKEFVDSEWRVAISWTENELRKTVYLPRQALSNTISRGDARVTPRPGWNVATRQYLPEYLQTGHVQIEIMGDEVVFSDLGSTNQTTIELRSSYADLQRSLIQDGAAVGDWLLAKRDEAAGGSGQSESGFVSSEEAVSLFAESLRDKLIVLGALDAEGATVNPQKGAQFPFDRPFQVSLRVDKRSWAVRDFVVREGQLHTRRPPADAWVSLPENRYRTEEDVPVAGQTERGEEASKVAESYEVFYAPGTNTVLILNHSPYQLQITPLSPDAGGLEEWWEGIRSAAEGAAAVVIGPSVAEAFGGLEELARVDDGRRIFVDRGADTVVRMLEAGLEEARYYGGSEEAAAFRRMTAGILAVSHHLPSQGPFLAQAEAVLRLSGVPEPMIRSGLEEFAALLDIGRAA